MTLLLLLCAFMFTVLQVQTKMSGPYTIELLKIEPCEDQGTKQVDYYNLTKRENGNHDVNLYVGKGLKTDSKICIEGHELLSNGSTKSYQFNCRTCAEAWSFLGDFFSNLMTTAGMEPEKCVFPKGNYSIKNWDVSRPLKMVPTMNYHNYTFNVTFICDGKKSGCNLFYIKFNPRKKLH